MSRFWLIAAMMGAGCSNNNGTFTAFKRILTTEDYTFDAGTVAVSDRYTMTIYLASTGADDVTVWNVYLEDESDTHWVVLPTWATDTVTNEAGEDVSALKIGAGTEENPEYAPVEISFRPDAEGYFRETLIIESNDSQIVEENPDNGNKLWKVVLRGVARYPCANVYPTFHDFGLRPAGGYFSTTVSVENCGTVTLTAANATPTADSASGFSADSVFPLYVIPGDVKPLILSWIPTTSAAESAEFTLVTNDPNSSDVIGLIGNDCAESVDGSWDRDADGWFSCGGDCDDTDADINPEAADNKDEGADGIDNDCDGDTDEGAGFGSDGDADGYTENDGDCMDYDATVYPTAPELLDEMDNDCDGVVDEGTEWYDDDGDGLSEREGDCDDTDAAIYPGATEAYDGVDNNCDTHVDEDSYSYDDDEDGYAELQADGSEGDCDDANPWVYPGATEDCDAVDNDCDSLIDEGADDTPDGACDFLVERDATSIKSDDSSCSTTGSGTSALAGLALAAALAAGRRRRT